MKRILSLVSLLLFAAFAHAQPLQQSAITAINSTPTATCSAGSCVKFDMRTQGTAQVQVAGTYTASGGLSLQTTVDGTTWVTVGGSGTFRRLSTGVSTATITSAEQGIYQLSGDCVGAYACRITALGAVTGTATVSVLTSTATAGGVANISGGAGDASAANQVAGNASLTSIDAGVPAALGQAVAANSMPVVLPVLQNAVNTQGSTTAGQSGALIQGAVTTSSPTYTTAQTSPLSLDTTGALRVNVTAGGAGGGAITAASGSYASGALSSGSVASGAFASGSIASGAMVDLGAIADAAATQGSTGTVSAKLREMSASLGTINTSLGTLNTSVNASTTQLPADGTGQVTMANSFPVVLASDQSAIALHGHGATGAAVPANVTAMGARAGANSVNVAQGSATAAINVSSATTTQLVALSGSTQIYVTGLAVVAGGTGNITLVYGTGSACGTGTTSLSGAIPLIANAGFTLGSGLGAVLVVPAGQALCITTSAAVQMSGFVTYTQF